MAINSLSHVSHGFAGLASGMNTEDIVQKMLYGTQSKLDRAKADKVILTYKRDMYRELNSSLKAFQNQFFSFAGNSGTNLLSQSFFRNLVAASSSSAVKVSVNGNANPGNIKIDKITQLAQNLKVESKNTVSAEIKSNANFDNLKDSIELEVKLDGVGKTITVNKADVLENGKVNVNKLAQNIQDQINQVHGGGINVIAEGGQIKFTATNSSRTIELGGDTASLGIQNGASNRVNLNAALKDTSLASKLKGDTFAFSINGKEFKFSKNDSINSIINTVNNSDAGVRLSYSSLNDKFSIESTVAGDKTSIKLEQTAGNFLNTVLGIDDSSLSPGASITAKPLELKLDKIETNIKDKDKILLDEINRLTKDDQTHKLSFTIDGKSYTAELTRDKDNDFTSLQEIVDKINNLELKDESGNNVGKVQDKIKFELNSDKIIAKPIGVDKNTKVELTSGFNAIGFDDNASNRGEITGDTKLSDLGFEGTINFNGKEIKVDKNTTVAEFNKLLEDNNIDAEIDLKQAPPRFRFAGVKLPIPIQIVPASHLAPDSNIFFEGGNTINAPQNNNSITIDNNTNSAGLNVTQGQNAKLTINGEEVERNSNNFTIDGINYELKDVTKPNDNPIDITVSREEGKTFEGIVKFMDEYNKLVDKIWEQVKAKPTYKEYPPLTPEQKKEMSESEIKLWEEKSKEGLLRSDPTLQAISNAMREVLNYKPEGSKYSLADLGITTSYDFDKGYGGKLIFTDSTGDKFKQMLQNEPDAVEKLFIGEDGISSKFNEVIKSATTTAKPGSKYYNLSLVSIAGSTGIPDSQSKLYNQMKDIDENIARIERKYKMEYNRYWKQFNAMENAIQQMNSQSSWLAQQFM